MSDEQEPVRCYMADVRAARMCSAGARRWFERQGFDYSDFLKNGIEAEKFTATGDPMALKVVEVAHGRRRR
jgi:hypothetical protein